MTHADACPDFSMNAAQAPVLTEPGGIPAAGLLLLPLMPFVAMSVGNVFLAPAKKSAFLPSSSVSSSP